MNDARDNSDFEARAARRLRASADSLDAATRSRLNRARQAALAELEPAPQRQRLWTAVAAASVAALAVGLWRAQSPRRAPGLPADDDAAIEFELLLAEETMEMFEDLEFYLWLAESPDDVEGLG